MGSGIFDDRIREIAASVASGLGFEFVHSQIAGPKHNPTVRVFIDKPGGITIEDCSTASRAIEARLDEDDFIPTSYVLEVSSPGLERELFSIEDFKRFSGKQAKVKTNSPINGQKNFSGEIVAVEGSEVVFRDKTSGEVRFDHGAVAKANLLVDLEEELRRS
ncbi:MAG: ribosome maturation factor RimP [Pyrinomonadaceae bacterium]